MERQRNVTCCLIGHRVLREQDVRTIAEKLDAAIRQKIMDGYIYFLTGGMPGFDTMAAAAVLRLRREFPQVKLILVLSCRSQADHWCEEDRLRYEEIRRHADTVMYTSQNDSRGCMQKRNRCLANCSSACICYLRKLTGGTAYTAAYAKRKGLTLVNLVG